MTWLEEAQRRQRTRFTEMDRVLALPRSKDLTEEEATALSRDVFQAKWFDGGWRLLPGQAAGLSTYMRSGGVFGRIRVGGGKTALTQLIAHHAHKKGVERILLLIPPDLCKQFMWRDLPWARERLVFNVPVVSLYGLSPKRRRLVIDYGRPGLYVMPYSLLSTRDTIENLKAIDAGLVIADEAHLLWGDSAKTKRFWSWFNERDPELAAFTGTPTNKSPMDYFKLAKGSLKDGSFLPVNQTEAASWAECVMSGAAPTLSQRQQMEPLVEWSTGRPCHQFPAVEAIRKAYNDRMMSTPGVVNVEDRDLGISLTMRNIAEDVTVPPEIQSAMHRVMDDWETPSGDILKFAIEKHAVMQQLAGGIYHRQIWPEVEEVETNLYKLIDEDPRLEELRPDVPVAADRLLAQAMDRHELGQAFARILRRFFKSQRKPLEGLDTPWAVCHHMATKGPSGVPEELYEAWAAWHELDDPLLPERRSIPVRLSSYKVDAAVAWAKRIKKGGIIWCRNKDLQHWMCEKLREEGLPVLFKGAGTTWLHNDGSEEFFCVASIDSHHKGKNLQHHRHQLILQWPRPAPQAEQLLGRLHRTGQEAPELKVDLLVATEYDHMQLASTLHDTIYDQETFGGRRKLLLASWAWEPKDYDKEDLKRWGFTLAGGE